MEPGAKDKATEQRGAARAGRVARGHRVEVAPPEQGGTGEHQCSLYQKEAGVWARARAHAHTFGV